MIKEDRKVDLDITNTAKQVNANILFMKNLIILENKNVDIEIKMEMYKGAIILKMCLIPMYL